MQLIIILAIVCYASAVLIYVLMPHIEFRKKDKEFTESFSIKYISNKHIEFNTTENKIKYKSNKDFFNKYYFKTCIYLIFILSSLISQTLYILGEIPLVTYIIILIIVSIILAKATYNNEPKSFVWGEPNISNLIINQLFINIFILFFLPLIILRRIDILIDAHYNPTDIDIVNKFTYINAEDILKLKDLNIIAQIIYTFKLKMLNQNIEVENDKLLNDIKYKDPLKENLCYRLSKDDELFKNYILYLQMLNYKLNNPLNLVFVSTFTENEMNEVESYILNKLHT